MKASELLVIISYSQFYCIPSHQVNARYVGVGVEGGLVWVCLGSWGAGGSWDDEQGRGGDVGR